MGVMSNFPITMQLIIGAMERVLPWDISKNVNIQIFVLEMHFPVFTENSINVLEKDKARAVYTNVSRCILEVILEVNPLATI